MRRRSLLGVAGASLAGAAGCLGATEYTVTDVSVGDVSAPLALRVELTEPNAVVEHPATLTFSLSNERERPIRVRNTGIWPFGLLELVPSIDAEEAGGTILWTERYAESDEVDATNHRDYGATSKPLVRSLDPGERVSDPYELHGDSLGVRDTGVQFVRGEFDPPIFEYAAGEGSDWEPFLPEVRVVIEEKRLL
jgi:hypothetical protein